MQFVAREVGSGRRNRVSRHLRDNVGQNPLPLCSIRDYGRLDDPTNGDVGAWLALQVARLCETRIHNFVLS